MSGRHAPEPGSFRPTAFADPANTFHEKSAPLPEQFDAEYHYLFACVHRASVASPAPPLEQNYSLPNLARRLLESFLAFRQPHIAGELWQKLQLVTFDETKKIRIIRFLHTHSHHAALGEPEHDLSLLSEAQAILKDLLDLIESQDKDHFNAMKSLVTVAAAEEATEEAPVAAG
jgi:wobble nucleotide-excising tRNase